MKVRSPLMLGSGGALVGAACLPDPMACMAWPMLCGAQTHFVHQQNMRVCAPSRSQALWVQLEAEEAAAAAEERVRMAQLAQEVKAFNDIRRTKMSEAERMERCVAAGEWLQLQ